MSHKRKKNVEELLKGQNTQAPTPVTFIAQIDTENRGVIGIRVVGESGYQVLSTLLEQGIMTQSPDGKYLGIPAKMIRSIEMIPEPTQEDVQGFPGPTEAAPADV